MAKDKSKDGRGYMAWAGIFCDPERDAELFGTLPGWRQREVLFIREQRAKGVEPSPAEINRVMKGRPTAGVAVSLPSSLTLASLRRRKPTPEPDEILLAALKQVVTPEAVIQHCTSFGEGEHLVTNKPSHGLFAYIWALTMIRRGAIDHLPLPYFWELEEGIHAATGAVFSTRGAGAVPLLAWLDGRAAELYTMVP